LKTLTDARQKCRPTLAGVLLLIASLCSANGANGHDGAFTFTIENDIVTGSDSDYSNGAAISWVSDNIESYGTESSVRRWSNLWDFLPGRGDTGERSYVGWSLVQQIHTPEDLEASVPPPGESPYAGLLYLDSVIYSMYDDWGQAWSIRAGVVGPASLAEQTQKEVHRRIDSVIPQGWDSQLPNEPLLNVGYTAGYNWRDGVRSDGAAWRVRPLINAELGTYATAFGAGVIAEYGWNLPEAIGVSAIGKGIASAMALGVGPSKQWAFSVFAGAGAYVVAHYLPLDGTVFRDSLSGDHDTVVGQFSAGATLRKGNWAINFNASFISDRSHGLDNGIDYGTITLLWYP